jgi:hypothetical protein
MAELTPRNEWTYPSEFEEPYFAPAQDNAIAVDAGVYANAENSQLQFLSVGVVGWDKDGISPTTGLLFWSDVIQITGWSTPFKAFIAGPASVELDDGEVLFFLMPRLLAQDTQVEIYRANRIFLLNQRLHDLRLFAARIGDVVYFYNGKSLKDGDTGLLFGGGLISTSLFPPHKHLAALVIEPPSAGVSMLNMLSASPALTKVQLFRNGLIQSDPADYSLNLVTGILVLVIPTVSAVERFVALREETDLSVVTTTHSHLTELTITPPPATVMLDMLVVQPPLEAIELFRLGQLLSEPADYSLDLTTGFVTLTIASVFGDRFQAFRRISV